MVDDKLRILDSIKKAWGPRVTTVFVRQGHYAHDTKANAQYAPADMSLNRIDELQNYGAIAFGGGVGMSKGAE